MSDQPRPSDSESDAEWEAFVRGLVDGDSDAYNAFWQRYGKRLSDLARNHFPPGLARRLGPEDIVQSTCRSFFHRVTTGRLTLSDGESLWGLLCAITLNKTRMKQRFHLAQRRAANREQDLQAGGDGEGVVEPPQPNDQQLPDESVMFAEQLETVMDLLDPTERKILQLKLDDHTNDEIAAQVRRSERTVRRVLERLQAKLQSAFADSLHPGS